MKKIQVFLVGLIASFFAFFNTAWAIDTTGIQTAITSATSDGETVGGYVIIAVVTLVAVSLIIGVVRKI